jgi:hypothetical protein
MLTGSGSEYNNRDWGGSLIVAGMQRGNILSIRFCVSAASLARLMYTLLASSDTPSRGILIKKYRTDHNIVFSFRPSDLIQMSDQ